MTPRPVFQFKITLQEIEPAIWRRIQISNSCSFWDLHVAIQNVMGWTDSHLHHFAVIDPVTGDKQYLGIPAEDEFDFDVHNTQPDWNFRVRDYLITGYYVNVEEFPGDIGLPFAALLLKVMA